MLCDPDRYCLARHVEQDFDVHVATSGAAQAARQPGKGEAPTPGANQSCHIQLAFEIAATSAGNPGIFAATPHPDAPTGIVRIPQSLDPGHYTPPFIMRTIGEQT